MASPGDIGDLDARLDAALVAHRAGRRDDAIAQYDAILAIAPDHARALHLRGIARLQANDAGLALVDLQRAATVAPTAATELHRGDALRALGRLDEADEAYDAALALDPGLADVHVSRGNLLRARGRHGDAELAYRSALALDPASFPAASNLARTIAARPEYDDDASLAAYQRAFDNAFVRPPPATDLASLHVELGALHLRASRWADARAEMEAALALSPDEVDAFLGLGRALTGAGDLEGAAASLATGTARCPGAARLWEMLALTLRRLGRGERLADVYRGWLAAQPGNAVAQHLLAAVTGQAPPEAGAAYIVAEFDVLAPTFDGLLRDRLGYRGPELVAAALASTLPPATRSEVVDLGCGTGLCGPLLRPFASRLVGVDLSPRMLERAVDRGYDELVQREIMAWCAATGPVFDVAVAADVLIYFGDLTALLAAARVVLRDGGRFAATLERAKDPEIEWTLGSAGRYAHGEAYVRTALARAGFEVVHLSTAPLRIELGEPVDGWVVVAALR